MCFPVFTRAVYLSELEKPENVFSCLLTRAVYFNELDEREKYTVRLKKPENVFSCFSLTKLCLEGSYLVS